MTEDDEEEKKDEGKKERYEEVLEKTKDLLHRFPYTIFKNRFL